MNNHKLLIHLLFTFSFAFASLLGFAQKEVKAPLQSNIVIQKYVKEHPFKNNEQKSVQNALLMPFFDDFSTGYVYPDQTKWIGRSTYLNDDFSINPPTVGVISFDGLDSVGKAYQNTSQDYPADTLTSRPIDLSLLTHDSTIYLSFFYQAAGLGDAPDAGDSLVLQFLNKDTVWITVWAADGNSAPSKFKQVFVHVYDTIFYDNGIMMDTIVDTFRTNFFQFRFMNYVSGYGMVDIWNLDYVLMDRNRNPVDTTMLDEAFVYRGPSLLKNYREMPWTHYMADSINQMGTDYPITIMNNDINSHFLFFHSLVYQSGNATPIYQFPSTGGYGFPINPDTLNALDLQIATGIPTTFTFPSQPGTFAEFPITHYIENTGGDFVYSNDTIKNVQRFSDYYAYDDGTAESALYLAQPGGELAMQFTTTKADTLQGVYMFFPKMAWNTALDDFALAVWKDSVGYNMPGTLIYKRIEQFPIYDTTQLNGFAYYPLDSNYLTPSNPLPLKLTAGTYYFGYIQGVDYPNYNQALNIGLDENSNWDSSKLYINVLNYWTGGTVAGTVMIRPVFGSSATVGISNQDNQLASALQIYPNPATDKINMKWTAKEHVLSCDLLIQIYDLEGRMVLEQAGFQKEIDIHGISEGFYFVKITDTKSLTSFTKKLIINR